MFGASAKPPARPVALASGSSALAGDIASTIGTRPESTARVDGSTHNAVTQSDGVDDIAAPRRKRRGLPLVLIGGGAAVAIAIVMVVMLRGGGDESSKRTRVSANDPAAKTSDVQVPETVDTRATQDEPGGGSQMRIDEAARVRKAGGVPASGSDTAPTETPPVTEQPPVPTETVATVPAPPTPPPAPVKRPSTLGGKKVVLEYDSAAPKEVPKKAPVAAKGDDSASIGAARITYFNGNRKLFSGDADSAIKLYKQALGIYPGYVAGYRGLGLAYAQKGDKANALKAFRTYIAAVPGAKDIALVKKRIAALQK
jgi:hypothetical protein